MADNTTLLECPMCDFTVLPTDDYILHLHFEQSHTTDSPFKIEHDAHLPLPASSKRKHVRDTPSDNSEGEEDTVACPEPDCGEVVALTDFNDHLDFHAAESLSFDETTKKYHSHHSSATMHNLAATHPHAGYTESLCADYSSTTNLPETLKRHDDRRHKSKKHGHRARSNTTSSEKSTLSRSILTFNPFAKLDKSVKPPNKSARLGKSELGPYAWEERMPRWLFDQIAAGPKITVVNRIGRDGRLIKQEQVQNETPGIIPILAQLSALDRSVREAYYCHPSTLHIGKTPREGGFCGYRNIQMLLSYIQGAKAQGHEEFPGRTPGILNLQDLIENAWDKSINPIGRIQTGGIRGTRKYIGTPEAQAFFLSSEINCAVETFSDIKERKIEAHETLLDAIERYFSQAAVEDGSSVHKTLLPPIYLQQPGHSITIIGFERRRDGSCNLVVLDPMYSTSPAMYKLLGRKNIQTARPEVLHAYRRSPRQLKKHAAFEILMLTATPPLFPAWDVLRQFPDCRFVYAFFRSRTLGYDVYPEDYFIPNFPWQRYGGLWICDEARFARSEPMNPLAAQALRRITGEGSLPGTSISGISPTCSFTSSAFHNLPSTNVHMNHEVHTQLPAFVPSLDGSSSGYTATTPYSGSSPVFNMGSPNTSLTQPSITNPHLSLLTEVGRKYPGFPSPLSPTLSAKDLFPSPASDTASHVNTPLILSPGTRTTSPMSIDGSEMCGPSRRCASHGFEHYNSHMGTIDSVIAQDMPQNSLSRSVTSTSSASHLLLRRTMSPPRPVSPRTTMLKMKLANQSDSSYSPEHRTNCMAYSPASDSSPPSIPISNGTESYLTSPLSPSGTILAYTSHRPITSGLLALNPLSEAQVAEYRFWTPCGRRGCAFGCGMANEGEMAAAKRLFRGVEEEGNIESGFRGGEDGEEESGGGKGKKSVWAGRRMVGDWAGFLKACEREGVAKF
ncbi:peptidase family C78-domain-containing protein [Ampelomyces quisqualis]|uniref:Peptidase family C78-domain-containing protein n=1 Tax=Ampelomyces quisqualis TaxID=50730 RepID=A0A6A5QKH0_AMPQU|nr:peptidase family C78-domain-containing protein [Ampelomyces quisqualis]